MSNRYAIAESPSGVGIVAPTDYVLISNGDGTWTVGPQTGGGSVISVFDRTGTVHAENNDYAASQVFNDTEVPGNSVGAALGGLQDRIDNEVVPRLLPAVSSADNGKVLAVGAGVWGAAFQYPIQQFSTIIDSNPFVIDAPPGTEISQILPTGQYLVTLSVNNVNSNVAGQFSIQVGTGIQGGTSLFTIVPSQLTTGESINQGSVVLESDGTQGLRLAETQIVALTGASHMRFNVCVTRLK